MNDAIRMQLSAYVDGELPENEAEMLLRRVSQDVELRQEIAEYLAMGRLMRGESGIAEADRLHERVAAEIDHRPFAEGGETIATSRRLVRPLAGIAIAATVAVLAIVGLQQTRTVEESGPDVDYRAHTDGVPDISVRTEQNREFFRNHANASSQLGANGMNSRLVALRFSAEFVDESDVDEAEDDNDESTEAVTQP